MSLQKPNNPNRGLAMLEVLIAVGLLALSVSSVTTAIVAGQQQSLHARERIVGSVAAESLLSQVLLEPWETLMSWHGYKEQVGTITDPSDVLIGGDWDRIGRQVAVVESQIAVEPLQVLIVGRTITVSSFDEQKRILASIQRFIPEPPQ